MSRTYISNSLHKRNLSLRNLLKIQIFFFCSGTQMNKICCAVVCCKKKGISTFTHMQMWASHRNNLSVVPTRNNVVWLKADWHLIQTQHNGDAAREDSSKFYIMLQKIRLESSSVKQRLAEILYFWPLSTETMYTSQGCADKWEGKE